MLRAQLVGKEKAEHFFEQRIKKSNVGFYDTIKKNKLKTFHDNVGTSKVIC